jgi:hypothetical protein
MRAQHSRCICHTNQSPLNQQLTSEAAVFCCQMLVLALAQHAWINLPYWRAPDKPTGPQPEPWQKRRRREKGGADAQHTCTESMTCTYVPACRKQCTDSLAGQKLLPRSSASFGSWACHLKNHGQENVSHQPAWSTDPSRCNHNCNHPANKVCA